jgi:hypothetical protein
MTTSRNFYCTQCGALAATLTINDQNQLVQEGFWGMSTKTIHPTRRPKLEAALLATNASALYRMDRFWTPFYCPTCDRVYCYNHWLIIPQFDDDFPGWYDCAYGTCPQGHRRLVDD